MTEQQLDRLHCERCGHNWWPRKPEPPTQCPRCRSAYYDKPRQRPERPKKEKGNV